MNINLLFLGQVHRLFPKISELNNNYMGSHLIMTLTPLHILFSIFEINAKFLFCFDVMCSSMIYVVHKIG